MTQVRGNQLKNQSVTKTQIGNKEVTGQQIADGTITDQQVSPTAGIQQSKIDGLVASLANKLDKDGSSAATGPIILAGDPVDPLDAAPKQYVDKVAAGSKALLTKNFNLLDDNIDPMHAPFSTIDLGTQTTSVFDNSLNFTTIGHSNYAVMTTTVAVDTGVNQFLYQLGGSQGTQATEIRNVSRTMLANDGSQGTWTAVGSIDLPENATSIGKADVLISGLGKHIIFAKGKGDNLVWRSKAINNTTGDYSGWDLLSPLPVNTGDPDIVILTVNGIQTGYILANNIGGSSELVIADFDVNADITNYSVNTIPQSIIGKLVALNNQFLYIFGVGADSNKCFIGTINQTTRNVSWSTISTAIPAGLTKFGVSIHGTIEGNNQVFIYGGSLNGTLQNTIYYATVDGTTGSVGTFNTATATLEVPTAGMGISSIKIGTNTYVYATGGQTANGFIDNSTSKETVAIRTFHTVRRTIDAGTFYHVNKSNDNRPQQDFNISPDLQSDSTLSRPINVAYFARKDNLHSDYQITTAVDPLIPADLSDNENLLIRIDQIDPLTGDVKTIPVVTSPVQASDYLEFHSLTNQVLDIANHPTLAQLTSVEFFDEAFTIGFNGKIYKTVDTTFSGLTNGVKWVYWSNFELILSDVILSDKILVARITKTDSLTVVEPVTAGTVYHSNNLISLAPNAEMIIFHGFNSSALTNQILVSDEPNTLGTINPPELKIILTNLNEIKLKNTGSIALNINEILIKKEA